jgi:hypothetical protein
MLEGVDLTSLPSYKRWHLLYLLNIPYTLLQSQIKFYSINPTGEKNDLFILAIPSVRDAIRGTLIPSTLPLSIKPHFWHAKFGARSVLQDPFHRLQCQADTKLQSRLALSVFLPALEVSIVRTCCLAAELWQPSCSCEVKQTIANSE